MKIYTRTGDQGKTRIIGHDVLYKSDKRVQSYGMVDELNSFVGLTIADLSDKTKVFAEELLEVQQLLFDCGSDLAKSPNQTKRKFVFTADNKATEWLENRIDFYTEKLPKVQKFILPGGCKTAADLHVDRTVTRRTERSIVDLMQDEPINQEVLKFINRLSDYFFTLSRYANVLEEVEEVSYRNSRIIFR
ncbi:cob(I)yrinic acid a,c-diamide adenosyltransferase [Companilactobacillus versmoldensis]|uniref:Corrinoid adenosyltransferase n=1 Tax=Companilactobacillus versmoldensis DSM 14857 = KCTC 3814 TaxID=1423815 RepID=A0A0R1SG89_9LACO|nr:cob(I)yrinic acid a,c-diamide adenosyltransferase [Companilactobacillus versmoldensis]KRL68241.1 ATP cob(I)alamin adenosyltransferase [Companilactobacillus versmoldensis DSM 14857 = KCTC 3814]